MPTSGGARAAVGCAVTTREALTRAATRQALADARTLRAEVREAIADARALGHAREDALRSRLAAAEAMAGHLAGEVEALRLALGGGWPPGPGWGA